MGIAFSAVINILTQSPGDLVYHLVIMLSLMLIIGSAVATLGQAEARTQARHVLIGCGMLLLFQILHFSTSRIPGIGLLGSALTRGIIERLINLLMILWLIWTFLEEKQSFIFTGLSIFLTLALIFMGTASILLVTLQPEVIPALDRWILMAWEGSSLGLSLVGLVLILATKPGQWAAAVGILAALAASQLLQIIFISPESVQMGSVRLAQTLTFPWMIVLLQRFAKPKTVSATAKVDPGASGSDMPVDTKPMLVDYLLSIPLQETPEEKYRAIARAVSLSIVADICYLVKVSTEKNKITILGGYDLIREEYLQPASFERHHLPHIMDAWANNQSLNQSQSDADTRDALTLTHLLRYHRIGNLLAYPLPLPDHHPAGGILLLSPYTGKIWGQETHQMLDKVKTTLARVLFSPTPVEQLKKDLVRARTAEVMLLEQQQTYTQTISQLENTIEDRAATVQQLKARYQIEKIETVKQINQLQEKLRQLAIQAADSQEKDHKLEQIKVEIHQLVTDRDQLRTALARAQARIKDLENQSGQTGPIRLSTESQILSLDSIAATVRLRIASQLQPKQVSLEVINPDGRQMIKTDPGLLQTILNGLLENAIQASHSATAIELSLKLSFETGMLIIQVTDFGEGLTQAEQHALFSETQPSIPGIGSIPAIRDAVRAIRLLNGKIWLRSKEKTFTTFRVQLPVRIID